MRNLTATLCLTLFVLGSAGKSFALPSCPTDRHQSTWSYCFGTFAADGVGKYVGEFRNGLPNGQGTATSAKGDKYVGEFRNANQHGQGTLTYADGRKYVGEFRNGLPNGQGTYTFGPSLKQVGKKYVGEFRDGEFHGQGTLTSFDGRQDTLDFHAAFEAAMNAPGLSQETKDQAAVELDKMRQDMMGVYSREGVKEYVGEFRNNNMHGQGTLTYADGRVKEGIWEDDKFKYAQKVSPTQKQPAQSPSNLPLDKAEKKCAEIGFTKGTEKFGDCVMKLLN